MTKRKLLTIFVLLMTSLTGLAQKANLAPDIQSLVDTERAFAHTATEKSVRDSFLAFIADDGVLFRPTAVNGKQFLEKQQSRPGLLSWDPSYAEISRAGDLGITSGPWEFRPKTPQDEPVAYGTFMTVWKKQADGSWRFMIDYGVGHPKPTTPPAPWKLPANFKESRSEAKADVEAAKAALIAIEQKFSNAAQKTGMAKAYINFAGNDVRWLREGLQPVIGFREATAAEALRTGTSPVSWKPVKAEVAASGELGYTYGTFEMKPATGEAKQGNYVRIWQKQSDGRWLIVLDVMGD